MTGRDLLAPENRWRSAWLTYDFDQARWDERGMPVGDAIRPPLLRGGAA